MRNRSVVAKPFSSSRSAFRPVPPMSIASVIGCFAALFLFLAMVRERTSLHDLRRVLAVLLVHLAAGPPEEALPPAVALRCTQHRTAFVPYSEARDVQRLLEELERRDVGSVRREA